MSPFAIVLTSIIAGNALWWWWAHAWLGRAAHPRRWRWGLAAFMLVMLAGLAWLLASRMGGIPMPTAFRVAVYVWHLVALLLGVVIAFTLTAGSGIARLFIRRGSVRQRVTPPAEFAMIDRRTGPQLTRRQVLAAAAVAAPPLAGGAGLVKGMLEIDQFRVRNIDIPFPGLPSELDGATIAHVTDLHVGRFTDDRLLRDVRNCVNAMRPDIVLLTGDLIDHALADLATGLETVRRFDAPVYMCEGNHDLFEGREAFELAVRRSGVPLLLNESAFVTLRGHPVQVLGIRWGRGRDLSSHDASLAADMAEIARLRQEDAFQILLAHHPHAFDHAAGLGIPLTLSGHTHGGQLMLSSDIGPGPMLYRYWSGLYRKQLAKGGTAACVVSNGVGNWFPLRLNAPAEIVRVKLRRA